MGTYQGEGYPSDDTLDYETNVDKVVEKEFADYYGENGEVLPQYQRYVSLQKDGIKASYRQQVWWDTDCKNMLYSYGVIKPYMMIESVFLLGYGIGSAHRVFATNSAVEFVSVYRFAGCGVGFEAAQETHPLCHSRLLRKYIYLCHDIRILKI